MRSALPTTSDKRLLTLTRAAVELALVELDIYYRASTKEAVTHCIFHADDIEGKPNLYINIDGKVGTYHCFRCGAKGTFTEFVQKATGWSIVKTLSYVLKLRKRVSSPNVDAGAEIEVQLPSERASAPQEETLAAFDNVHEYLTDTRKLSFATLKDYRVGYDPNTDQITLPWFSPSGVLITIKRRKIGTKFYSYDTGVDLSTTLFGLHKVPQHAILWIVEGEFDALAMNQFFRLAHYTKHYAVALGGSALRPSQLRACLRKEPQAIVLMLDNDEAGQEATKAICRSVAASVKCVIAQYPPEADKDPDALTFEHKIQATNQVESQLTNNRKTQSNNE